MKPIVLGDPAWLATFPHRVTPKPGEALASLLLRCDKENRWASGITCAHLKDVVQYSVDLPDLIVPSPLQVEALAQWLDLPTGMIAATTYLSELVRFFGTPFPSPEDLGASDCFHICPECLRQHRVLKRCHMLPEMTICQQHQLSLATVCSCGAALQPFDPRTSPFTCPACQKDWGKLPQVQAEASDLERERQILACYEWWLRYGDLDLMKQVFLRLMYIDILGGDKHRPARSSRRDSNRGSKKGKRRAFRLKSSFASLSMLVNSLEVAGHLSHFSLRSQQNDKGEDGLKREGNHARNPSSL